MQLLTFASIGSYPRDITKVLGVAFQKSEFLAGFEHREQGEPRFPKGELGPHRSPLHEKSILKENAGGRVPISKANSWVSALPKI